VERVENYCKSCGKLCGKGGKLRKSTISSLLKTNITICNTKM